MRIYYKKERKTSKQFRITNKMEKSTKKGDSIDRKTVQYRFSSKFSGDAPF